ncbi:type I restriction endonuclease subunit M [Variovorax sp. J22R193]|uniref:type I restriction endonuclease subunit M n=1 Tax=Variovorax fucosicus TaxID=3053517 RepID=UPI0025778AAF|nr:type I restriction endonuclease subunit M [Variovorax sp. J22R193]MDM0042169.1 type I restriction endonuclease subunit M [Variovorax sp. J22R193]
MPLFVPGTVVATKGALAALDRAEINPLTLLNRHVRGDWGDLGQEDCDANKNALTWGGRLLSKYLVKDHAFYVITEADYSSTTLMLTQEY